MQQLIYVVALFAAVALLLLFIYTRKSKNNTILLLGASSTGKTTFLYQLLEKEPKTVASIEPHEIVINSKRVIDLPGHERLWFLYEKYIESCLYVIFFMDDQGTGLGLLQQLDGVNVYCISSERGKKLLDKAELQVQLEFITKKEAVDMITI